MATGSRRFHSVLVLGLSVAEEFGSSRLCLRACLRPRLHPCPRLQSRAQVVMSVLHSFFFFCFFFNKRGLGHNGRKQPISSARRRSTWQHETWIKAAAVGDRCKVARLGQSLLHHTVSVCSRLDCVFSRKSSSQCLPFRSQLQRAHKSIKMY